MRAPVPPDEYARLRALRDLEILDTPPEEAFDRVAREAAATFGVPIALVSLVDEGRQFWKAQTGLPADLAAAREAPRETSVCGHVVAAGGTVVVEDVAADPRFAGNTLLRERGIRFYAGAPLRARGGLTLGTLCVIDTEPRTFGAPERERLQALADEVAAEIARRGPPAAGDRAAPGTQAA